MPAYASKKNGLQIVGNIRDGEICLIGDSDVRLEGNFDGVTTLVEGTTTLSGSFDSVTGSTSEEASGCAHIFDTETVNRAENYEDTWTVSADRKRIVIPDWIHAKSICIQGELELEVKGSVDHVVWYAEEDYRSYEVMRAIFAQKPIPTLEYFMVPLSLNPCLNRRTTRAFINETDAIGGGLTKHSLETYDLVIGHADSAGNRTLYGSKALLDVVAAAELQKVTEE